MTNLSFYSGNHLLEEMAYSVVIVTGVARSGKSTIGNILGSCRNVENIEEPWLPMMLPILAGNGVIPESLAIQWFRTSVVELLNDRILMRNVNFRPNDTSSIWKQKSVEEILQRLVGLDSREDVRLYTQEHQITLVMTLTNTVPYCDFFWKAIPGCKVVHVIRGGLEVALEVSERGWLDDKELLDPVHGDPYRAYLRPQDGLTYHLPHWVEDDKEEPYLKSPLYIRSLQYWRRLVQMASSQEWSQPTNKDLNLVKLDDLLDDPAETVRNLTRNLGVSETESTDQLISNIYREKAREIPDTPVDAISAAELEAASQSYQDYGIATDRIDRLLSRAGL